MISWAIWVPWVLIVPVGFSQQLRLFVKSKVDFQKEVLWRGISFELTALQTIVHARSYVVVRLMSVFYHDWLDWNDDFLGEGAAEGLYRLAGLSEKEAKAMSSKSPSARKQMEKPLLSELQTVLPDVIRELDSWGVMARLETLGLKPWSVVNLEHWLCEYRKITALCGGRYYSREPFEDLLSRGPSAWKFPSELKTLLALLRRREDALRWAIFRASAMAVAAVAQAARKRKTAAATLAASKSRRKDVERPQCKGCGAAPVDGDQVIVKVAGAGRWKCQKCGHKFTYKG